MHYLVYWICTEQRVKYVAIPTASCETVSFEQQTNINDIMLPENTGRFRNLLSTWCHG